MCINDGAIFAQIYTRFAVTQIAKEISVLIRQPRRQTAVTVSRNHCDVKYHNARLIIVIKSDALPRFISQNLRAPVGRSRYCVSAVYRVVTERGDPLLSL